MLPYQLGAVENWLRSRACLVVLGRGLGTQKVLLEAFRRALAAGQTDGQHSQRVLVLLNTPQEEAELLAKRASADPLWSGLRANLTVIGPDFSVEDRANAFARGGAFIANARILVPDLLSGRVLPETIDGIFVNHAHGVAELSADAFVLRLFRLKNQRGFVRAISDMPDAFARGQGQLEKVMQRCFINDLEIWPRIRKEVQDCLSHDFQPEVRQINLELPRQVQQIQRHILNIVQGTLGELKKDPNLELNFQVRDSVAAAFEAELRQILDPAWQNLGPQARRLVGDLGAVRRLLTELLRGDAVEFLRLLENLCDASPVWLHSPDAQALLALAKDRVYEVQSGRCVRKLEPHAKWAKVLEAVDQTLSDVIQQPVAPPMELKAEPVSVEVPGLGSDDSDLEMVAVHRVTKKPRTEPTDGVLEPRVLVIAPEDRSRLQVSALLHRGVEAALLDRLGAYLRDRGKRDRDGLVAREAEAVAQELQQLQPRSSLQMREVAGRLCHPRVDVAEPDSELEARLEEMQPHTVVVLEPSLQAIRTLEVYCANLGRKLNQLKTVKLEPGAQAPTPRLQVYLLAFEDSIEKYRYQQSLLQESQAVDSIIRFRQHVTWKVDPPTEVAPPELSSRRGGGARALQAMVKPRVVVDMREFRSTLPFMLHLRGLAVEPVTIPVGDYVLSRDICVERKAIIDLVQSLASGRLYQQAQNLCQYYSNPLLLVEFDPAKGFVLQSSYQIARREIEVGTRDLLGKLSLLVLHFPKLRLMWSPSPRFTADVYLKLKEGRYQPDSKAAAQIDAEEADVPHSNTAAFDVLRKLPGVTPRNMHALARKAGTLAAIPDLSLEELAEVMGKPNAEQLHSFVHASHLPAATQDRGPEIPEHTAE